jgi:MFS transporter, DHA2 family, multidrug resistance protein
VPQRYWAVVTVAIAITLSVLDGAIANVALPTIAHEMGAAPAESIWVVNAYQLAIMISLLPLASLGDIVEYRRVYIAGLVVFTVASLGCALSQSLAQLIVARTVQGFGAAGIMSVNTALVRFIYPQHFLGRGIGINALVVGFSAALGPTIAAGILSVASWHWLFAINVPTGIAALALVRSLPRSQRAQHRFDASSALLNALGFGLLITGVDGIGHGERVPLAAAELAIAFLALALLVIRQLSQAWPLLPVDLLRIPMFALSISTSVCSFTAQMAAYVALPFLFQTVLGRSQVETGLLMTPWPLTTVVIAPIAGRLADRYPAGILGAIGLGAFALGLALLALLPGDPSVPDITWRMMICGFGFGLFQSPNNRAIIASAPRRRSGGASGMLSSARLFGQTIGAASVALLFGLFPARGAELALAVGAAIAVIAMTVSSLRLFSAPAAPEN